mgnify:CR=1 FL=1
MYQSCLSRIALFLALACGLAGCLGGTGDDPPAQTVQKFDLTTIAPGFLPLEPDVVVNVTVRAPETGLFDGREASYQCTSFQGISCTVECETTWPVLQRTLVFRGPRSAWRRLVRYQPRADIPALFQTSGDGILGFRPVTYISRWNEYGIARATFYASPGMTGKYVASTGTGALLRVANGTDWYARLYMLQRSPVTSDGLGTFATTSVNPGQFAVDSRGYGSELGPFCD